MPEKEILIRIFRLAFDQVDRHGVRDGQIQLAQRQTVQAPAGDEIRLAHEVAGGDYGTVVDAVEEPLRPHTQRGFTRSRLNRVFHQVVNRVLCPHQGTVIAVVVVAVIDAEGGPLTSGIEHTPPRKLADGTIDRGQVGHLGFRPSAPKETDRDHRDPDPYPHMDSRHLHPATPLVFSQLPYPGSDPSP